MVFVGHRFSWAAFLVPFLVVVVVVVLHMPGLARWFTPGRSSCGFTLFIIIFFIIYLFCSSSASSFLCFFFMLLLLGVGCHSLAGEVGEVGCLCFLAGEVDCLFLAGGRLPFRQDFFPHGGDIACMYEGCSGGIFVFCH